MPRGKGLLDQIPHVNGRTPHVGDPTKGRRPAARVGAPQTQP